MEEINSYGQLISIGIPVESVNFYAYNCAAGGLVFKSTTEILPFTRDIKSFPQSIIDKSQCRLVDVDFEDPNLDVYYFEQLDDAIYKTYRDSIRKILAIE